MAHSSPAAVAVLEPPTTAEAEPVRAVRRRSRRRRALGFKIFCYTALTLLSLFILLPVSWMFAAALKPDLEPVFTLPPTWFPTEFWHWENFQKALTSSAVPMLRYTLNTCVIVVGNILGTLLSCSIAAYAFARLRFRGSKVLFYVLIVTMLIPWQALMIPQFLLFLKLGWYGTYYPLIVPSFGGTAFFIFLIRQYMRTIPKDLDDAARVDGLSTWQIFWRIILPLSTPALTVCAVFVFIWTWANLLGPLIYLNDNSQFTVAIGLANLSQRAGNAQWNVLMAANLISIIPPIVVYFVLQRRLIGGIASVGLKG